MEYLKCFVLFYLNQSLWNLTAVARAVVAAVAVLSEILNNFVFQHQPSGS
jgi:hypothetical protein